MQYVGRGLVLAGIDCAACVLALWLLSVFSLAFNGPWIASWQAFLTLVAAFELVCCMRRCILIVVAAVEGWWLRA